MMIQSQKCNLIPILTNKALAISFLLALVTLLSSTVFAAALPDTINKIRPSIISVGLIRPAKQVGSNGPVVQYLGTGFVVGSGHQVITNNHVLPKNLDEEPQASLVVFVGRGKNATPRQAKIVATDQERDLALLEFSGLQLPALKLSKNGVREGQSVAFTGFPIGMVLGMYPSTNQGIISAVVPVVIPAVSANRLTAAQIKRIKNPYKVYQLDAIAYPGNSGSPVYEVDTGHVIGVVNSVFVKDSKEGALAKPSGITYAIPVKYVEALLAK